MLYVIISQSWGKKTLENQVPFLNFIFFAISVHRVYMLYGSKMNHTACKLYAICLQRCYIPSAYRDVNPIVQSFINNISVKFLITTCLLFGAQYGDHFIMRMTLLILFILQNDIKQFAFLFPDFVWTLYCLQDLASILPVLEIGYKSIYIFSKVLLSVYYVLAIFYVLGMLQ